MVIEKNYNNHQLPFASLDSIRRNKLVKDIKESNVDILPSTQHAPASDNNEEKMFRERYSQELKTKRQQMYHNYGGHNELEEERMKIRQQMMRTPGRRGEIIKDEELSKEFGRRFCESQEIHEN
jgi:hypothetical protein